MGIEVGKPKLDLPAMMKFKDEAVEANVKGVSFLSRRTRSKHFMAWVVLPDRARLRSKAAPVSSNAGGKAIVIATGSDVARLPGIGIDEKRILSSTGALALESAAAAAHHWRWGDRGSSSAQFGGASGASGRC
jgi:dihydrolipoamide dehydrogenase